MTDQPAKPWGGWMFRWPPTLFVLACNGLALYGSYTSDTRWWFLVSGTILITYLLTHAWWARIMQKREQTHG